MNDEKLSLPSRLALAALELRGWQADKRNKDGNYDYISADAVLHRAGQALGSNGVVIVPTIADHGYDVGTTASGKPRYDAWVLFDMTMVCEGGEILAAKWVGRGTDYTSVDKATYKAITSGHKYFLMKLLCIGVGNEDSEHDEAEEPSNSKPQAQPKKQSPAAKPKEAQLTVGDVIAELKKDGVIGNDSALGIIKEHWEPIAKKVVNVDTKVTKATAEDMYDHVIKMIGDFTE